MHVARICSSDAAIEMLDSDHKCPQFGRREAETSTASRNTSRFLIAKRYKDRCGSIAHQ